MSNSFKGTLTVYRRLFFYLKPYWVLFTIALFANLFDGALSAFFTYLIKPLLDKGFIARDQTFIDWIPAIIVFVFLLRGLSNLISDYTMAAASQGVIMRLRQAMFTHLQKIPAAFYDHMNSGRLLSTLTYNVNQLSNASADAIATFVQSMGMIVGLLVVMFSVSWQLTLIYFAALPIIMMIVYATSLRTRRNSLKIQAAMAAVVSVAQENIDGYRVVRSFGAEAHERNKFASLTRLNRKREMRNVIIKSTGVVMVQCVAAIVLAITVYLATSAHAGEILSAGGFMSMIAAMLAILKPMKDLTNVNNTIQRGVAGAQSVFETLDAEGEVDTGTQSITTLKGEVTFKNVSFAYQDTTTSALKNINVHVPAGKSVALVGHSGSGKSTFVSLLTRFYQDYTGVIEIDGVDIRQYRLSELRRQFAFVSQDVVLFDETIANNIAYGQPSKTNASAIEQAARLAHALEFIQTLPQGFQTMIGEDGVLLSGGQRQRLAIARAIFKNAPMLIFDEATSALDTESERFIQEGLKTLMQGRTTFIIAHRLSTIEHADMIVVLKAGEIVEAGTHAQLLAHQGHYAKLYRMQFKDENT